MAESRQYPQRPIVGVGAVIVDGARVLLIKRAHEPLKGEWSLPGGAVDVGETLEAAVAREVREETGMEITVGPVVDVLDSIRRDADGRVQFHFVIVDYRGSVLSGSATAGSDATELCWADVSDLGRYRLTDAVLKVIRKAAHLDP
jgi:8-oxo-dGTP diphosphatase